MATIDRRGYKRKATDSFKTVHDESPQYTRATPGNQLVCLKKNMFWHHEQVLLSTVTADIDVYVSSAILERSTQTWYK
jgi:hypothetical protein